MKKPASPLRRIALYAALALLGFSIVTASQSARHGSRGSRRERLVDLIAREDAMSRALRRQLDALQADVRANEQRAGRGESRLVDLQAEIAALGAIAGLTAVEGPGVAVELRDSTLREAPTGDPNDLVIHEQDLQAVVNGLWGGGAEAMSINGERITTTSAVRCVGNTLLLHGSVYAPPYRIRAIGDPARLARALDDDPLVRRFRVFADEFHLGFGVTSEPRVEVPAFRGIVTAEHARPRTA